MPTYCVTVFINLDAHFNPHQPEHRLASCRETRLTITAQTPEGAVESAFAIGNRMGTDDYGYAWPPWLRSMSVGDLAWVFEIVNGASTGGGAVFACEPTGWSLFSTTRPEMAQYGYADMYAEGHAGEKSGW